jgi:hypothetical protein
MTPEEALALIKTVADCYGRSVADLLRSITRSLAKGMERPRGFSRCSRTRTGVDASSPSLPAQLAHISGPASPISGAVGPPFRPDGIVYMESLDASRAAGLFHPDCTHRANAYPRPDQTQPGHARTTTGTRTGSDSGT